MQPVCRYSSIALESATIHRVFTIADGSDTLNLSTSNGVSINTKLPHGQYDPKELAGSAKQAQQRAFGKAMSDPTVFKEDTTKAQLRTFPKQTVVLPVDLESNYTSTFTYEDGNIPASDINKFVTENPGTISFISATDDFEIKVVRVPVGEVAGVRVVSSTDLTILASTMVISVFSSDPLVAHVLNLPDLAAEDGSAIPAKSAGILNTATSA
ncbi:hypothetical protein GHT06_003791 [Daphnia sinensis]|uniref:Uncharacterized protein n=1 Tax=Daphnia sinensis TaxID=1820382 RepID=A0AAD5KU64_9CRUS|nr:hypothetical protein GHT06_003791 [Daphnia sinensis]